MWEEAPGETAAPRRSTTQHFEPGDENADSLEQQVVAWLATHIFRDEWRYLKSHPALLSPPADALLGWRIAENTREST